MSVIFSDCIDCKNFIDESDDTENKLKCKAFPDGIPSDWFWNKCRSNRDKICSKGYKFIPLNEHI